MTITMFLNVEVNSASRTTYFRRKNSKKLEKMVELTNFNLDSWNPVNLEISKNQLPTLLIRSIWAKDSQSRVYIEQKNILKSYNRDLVLIKNKSWVKIGFVEHFWGISIYWAYVTSFQKTGSRFLNRK